MRRVLGLALVFGAAAIVAGCGTAARTSGPKPTTSGPRPDARDEALLASVLHGMKTDLSSVRLTQLSASWRKGRTPGALEIVTTTSVPRTEHVRSIRADWDTLLIAHAYNERCVRHADHCVAVYEGPSGGGGAGRSAAQRPFWSAHALERAIRHRFTAAGFRVAAVSFERPYALAPIVALRSANPRHAFAAERKAWVALQPALRHSEGSFVAMFGPHGRLLFVESGSGNTGEGFCLPLLHCPHP